MRLLIAILFSLYAANVQEVTSASGHEFPYVASIQSKTHTHLCGAAVLSPSWLITSGECSGGLVGAVGILQLGKDDKNGQPVPIKSIHYSRYLNETSISIALVQLSKPVKFDETVQPIKLPNEDESYVSKKAVVTGWGLGTDLKTFTTIVKSHEDCNKILNDLKLPELQETISICTISEKPGESLCYGDRGNPLVLNGILIGVGDIWFENCDQNNVTIPSIFAPVYPFLEFIKYNVKDLPK